MCFRTVGAVGMLLVAVVSVVSLPSVPVSGQEVNDAAELSVEQARLADRYERLEMVAARLAELSAGSDPRRARRLRDAISRSREQDVGFRFEEVVELLERERLSSAVRSQRELQVELQSLLEMLLKDSREGEIESEQRRIRKYLREIGRLIRWQKGIRARTEADDQLPTLSRDQQQAAEATGGLGGRIAETDGSQPPSVDKPAGETNSAEDQSGGSQQSTPSASEADGGESSDSSGQQGNSNSDGKPSEGQNAGAPSPGESGDGSPGSEQPTDRAISKLQQAAQRMQQARAQLDQAQRDGAVEAQQQALAELEQARAELERVLRQLREEELERTLTLLAARFRKMLEAQIKVYEGTLLLAEVSVDKRGHQEEIEAARLSRQESLIGRDADKALMLLSEEGSSVAFPETVEMMREDIREVTERLAMGRVGQLTQSLEQDIIEALEEAIAALDKALQDLEENRTPPGQGPPPGEPNEPPLVDQIAELKMIRSLQMRINRRTTRYGLLLDDASESADEVMEALADLANRQQRVYRATKDLALGRND